MTHSFDIEVAQKVGVNAAIIYQNIIFWIAKNEANGKNKINGHTWTYNSWSAWEALFPYMGKYQIKSALEALRAAKMITWEVGINPDDAWDKTAYYRIIENSNIDIGKNLISTTEKIEHVYKETDNKQQMINTDDKHNTRLSEVICEQAIIMLNHLIGTNYNPKTKATLRLVNARVYEGHDLNAFYKVIDKKVAEWKNDPKMRIYLRPETLFGTKFESYLNQKSVTNELDDWANESDAIEGEIL